MSSKKGCRAIFSTPGLPSTSAIDWDNKSEKHRSSGPMADHEMWPCFCLKSQLSTEPLNELRDHLAFSELDAQQLKPLSVKCIPHLKCSLPRSTASSNRRRVLVQLHQEGNPWKPMAHSTESTESGLQGAKHGEASLTKSAHGKWMENG